MTVVQTLFKDNSPTERLSNFVELGPGDRRLQAPP